MKVNLPVSQVEKTFGTSTELVSATDPKGIISHINGDFVEVSGFSEEELLGRSHNIVRHPDMPPEAFANMWSTLKRGESWMGIVKNRCKNGDHYWVNAYVTPVWEGDKVTGYESVRFLPDRDSVSRAAQRYEQLKAGKRFSCRRFGLFPRLAAAVTLTMLLTALAVWGATDVPAWKIAPLLGGGDLLLLGVLALSLGPLRGVLREAESIVSNPMMCNVYTGSTDETAKILFAFRFLKTRIRTVLGRIEHAAQQISAHTQSTTSNVEAANAAIIRQGSETEQVASAVAEMVASVSEVARNAGESARVADDSLAETLKGKQVIQGTFGAMRKLSDNMASTGELVDRLSTESARIGVVLEVIRKVAEQTNLLALNAAIEAARAGDNGRGFAVVADEVRELAQRSQDSTAEIEEVVESLQTITAQAAAAMRTSRDLASTTAEGAGEADQAMEKITTSVGRISELAAQIASATEEQANVGAEIGEKIEKINGLATESTSVAAESLAGAGALEHSAHELRTLVNRFKS